MSSNHVITWITGVKTIKWHTKAAYGWLVVGQSVGAGLAYSRLYACSVSDMTAPLQLRYAACGADVLYACSFV